MILNKFRTGSLFNLVKAFCLQLMALSLFSCNKTANINANKSYVGFTHVAYGVGPLSLTLDQIPLFSSIPFGATTGVDGNPYDTVTSRINYMLLYSGQLPDTTNLLQGNTAFQQGGRYSIFAYDSLDKRSISLIILQDNPPVYIDTFTSIRFMNFSPGSSIGIRMTYRRDYTVNDTILVQVRDTISIGPSLFVGSNPNPGQYTFINLVHVGWNHVFAFIDSITPAPDSSNYIRLDSLSFDSSRSYNVYLQGYRDSISPQQPKLKVRSDRVN
jgi:hypothetical protein